MIKAGVNTGVGAAFFALGAFWLNLSARLPDAHGLASFGPEFFPELVVVCMMVVAACLIVNDLRGRNRTAGVRLDKASVVRLALAIALSAAYIFLLPEVGYLPATVAALFLLLLLFGVRGKVVLPAISVLVPTGLYLLFEVVLKVLLP